MQAIQTKVLTATSTLPTRIVATCQAGRLVQSRDSLADDAAFDIFLKSRIPASLSDWERPHYVAAWKLAASFDWINNKAYGRLVGGTLKDGSMVWVFSEVIDPMVNVRLKCSNAI